MNKKRAIIIVIIALVLSYPVLRFVLYGNVQGKIVFCSIRTLHNGSYSSLYISNAFGFPQYKFSDASNFACSSAWSPDNRRIAYECQSPSSESSVRGICVINADGTNRRQITFVDSAGTHMNPVWSPDGQQIAFEWATSTNTDIYTVRLSGNSITQLTKTPERDWGASWSPDSKKIVFASERDGNSEIYMMNSDGSEQVNLTQNMADDKVPVWSKEGQYIFFLSDRLGNSEIFRLTISSQQIDNLTNSPEKDGGFSISPDGQKLAFTRESSIFVMNIDGTQQKRLTSFKDEENYIWDIQPTWSPDGKNIVFISYALDRGSTLLVMKENGFWEMPINFARENFDPIFSNP